MSFDFVIETPNKRGINRNNDKIIQKRATQAGARTRLENRPAYKSSDTNSFKLRPRQIVRSRSNIPGIANLYANTNLSLPHTSPFLSRFGDHGQLLYIHDPDESVPSNCFRLQTAGMSLLQRHVLSTLYDQRKTCAASRIVQILTFTHRSFMLKVSHLYGRFGFLDEAIECLIARFHETVPMLEYCNGSSLPDDCSPAPVYGNALRSLRNAIDNETRETLPYIWLTIILLMLFEVSPIR